jgi:predicted HD superfamily hydrolase involved in NAD metabolism
MEEIESRLILELESLCKPSRQAHSRSVAATAESLARRFEVDPFAARMAGLGHDLAKDRELGFQWELARRAVLHPDLKAVSDVVVIMESEKAFADKIIHGPAAAVYMREYLGIGDMAVLTAVSLHSQAALRMDKLSAILFVADKMEPSRAYAGIGEAEALRMDSLETLLRKALGLSIEWLNAKGYAIAQSSIDLYNALTMDKASE